MHPSVKNVLQFFEHEDLSDDAQVIAGRCQQLAVEMAADLCPQNAELTVGLRKLLEAKDCFVRAMLAKDV